MLALGSFLLTFIFSYLGTLGLLKLKPRRGFVDIPTKRSSHEKPRLRLGGIAIMGAFYGGFLYLLSSKVEVASFWPLVIGGAIIFSAGVIDDWRTLPVWVRFFAQTAAAVVLIASGNIIDHVEVPMAGSIDLGKASAGLTLLFILTSINFYNFIDGIDGLAAGSAFIAASFLAFIGYILGHPSFALLYLVLAGSVLGFLHFNFPPSRIFMGDGGSTFIGFFFAYTAIVGNRLSPELPLFIPVLILSSLYLDAGLTLVKRALKGERIFEAHHTHYYQRLLSLGLNHKQVTVLEYCLTVLLGLSAVIFFKAGGFFPVFLSLCWMSIFIALILKIRSLERGDKLFWERRTVLVVAVDIFLIIFSYIGAYFLRLNFRFTHPEGVAMLRALPIVLVVRSACFYWYGLYRGVWKYTSTCDVLRIVKAVTTGSAIILAAVVLLYRFVAFPRSLFVIEYFLLIVTIGGARFAFRLFHEFGKEALGSEAMRAAIIGAGDFGGRVGREVKDEDGSRISVACYIDDDKEKIGLTLRGVPIVGPMSKIPEICKDRKVDVMLLAISNLPGPKLRSIVRLAREAGVRLEGGGGAFSRKREPPLLVFGKLERALGREAFPVVERVEKFFEGKRVLITNGGAMTAPALAREILSLGAEVTVQIPSPLERGRYEDSLQRNVSYYLEDLAGETDVDSLLSYAKPAVVFHCLDLDVGMAENRRAFLWRKIVSSTAVLCKALSKYPAEKLVLVEHWGGSTPDSYEACMAALAEIVVLNLEDVSFLSPVAVRLGRVFGGDLMIDLPRASQRGEGVERSIFDLLESEAVSIVLGATALYRRRAVVIPSARGFFSLAAVEEILSGSRERTWWGSGVGSGRKKVGPLFPIEGEKPSVVPGGREVVGPIFPSEREFLVRAFSLSALDSGDERFDRLHSLAQGLFEPIPGRVHASFD